MMSVISHWSPENREKVESILSRYPEKRSAVMPLLYIASLEHEYASEDAMREVASLLDLSPVQVLSVASFYTMFKLDEVGDYLVSVCTSISCHLLGGDDVLAAVEEAAGAADGDTSVDGVISVEHAECIGACGGAPAVQVNYELIEGVTPQKAEELIKWLSTTRPAVVLSDEMQQLFGSQRSFDWGSPEPEGATNPVPAFGPYGSCEVGR